MFEQKWDTVTPARLGGFVAFSAVFFLLVLWSEPGFVVLLDHANLLFHEAGHPLVGFFSHRLEPYGGTFGQLFFPAVLVVSFWRKGEPLGVAGGSIWFFENCLNIARYLADAGTMALPLVGGGDHDWNTILARWNLLAYDTRLARSLQLIAWLGMAATCGWLLWRAWQDRRQTSSAYVVQPE